MRKFFSIIIMLFLFKAAGCKMQPAHYQVHYRGAIKTLMHEGDLRATLALDSLQQSPHLYALGAVENLKGEILIYNSQPFVSSVQAGEVVVARSFHHNAALLVYTQVRKWEEIAIPAAVHNTAALEVFLLQTAQQKGIDTAEPFPFLLIGTTAFVDWHVIDWAEGDTVHTHERHKASGLQGRLERQAVELLGFYSDRHQGIFTHRGSNMHLHVKTAGGDFAGHVDDLELHGETSLFLPQK